MKTGHLEEALIRCHTLSSQRLAGGGVDGELSQDGTSSGDSRTSSEGLVVSTDRPGAGDSPGHGAAARATGGVARRRRRSGRRSRWGRAGGRRRGVGRSKPAKPARRSGPASTAEPHREAIIEGLERGLSCQRIWQDLQAEHGFAGSYDSVKRFARRLRSSTPLPFRRMECAPGDEAQIDFGTGAPVITPEGKRRRTHVFRMVLSHSRKGYSEAVYRQTTEQFIRCMENAFCHFGGVPRTLVIDNLKAAVSKADWFDPDLNPKIQAFHAHYGTVILPTRPYTPRHKGKVERGVGFVQDNALKGKTFSSLRDQNTYLLDWETTVADTRIHGTTRKQVKKAFEEVERAALLPLTGHCTGTSYLTPTKSAPIGLNDAHSLAWTHQSVA